MYIKITSDIIDKANEEDQRCVQLIKLLDWTIVQGKHLVFGEKKDLDRIMGLDLDTKLNGFKYILNQYATIGSIVDQLKWHAEFSLKEQSHRDVNHKTICINIDDLPLFDVYKETHLLCENLSDINFYDYVLKFYKKLKEININNKYYPILGGGSTTHKVYRSEILKKNAFVVCIADSDKRSPNGSLGDTANVIQKVDRQEPFNAFFYHLEEVTEVENLIPINIYEKYISEQVGKEQKEKFLKIKTIGQHCSQYLDYFDMKKGITIKNILEEGENAKYQKKIATSIQLNIKEKCAEINQCIEEVKNALSHVIISKNLKIDTDKYIKASEVLVYGLGDNILDHILECQKCSLNEIQKEDLRLSQFNEYQTIGELLCNWTCCLDEVRS